MSSHWGLVQRFERRLEATVDNAFARVFGGSIVPQEVEALLRREADDGGPASRLNALAKLGGHVFLLTRQA